MLVLALWIPIAAAEAPEARVDRSGLLVAGDVGVAANTRWGGPPVVGQTGGEIGIRSTGTPIEGRARFAAYVPLGRNAPITSCRFAFDSVCSSVIVEPLASGSLIAAADADIGQRWSVGAMLAGGTQVFRHRSVDTTDAGSTRTALHPTIAVGITARKPMSEVTDYRFITELEQVWDPSGSATTGRNGGSLYLGVRFGAVWYPPRSKKTAD